MIQLLTPLVALLVTGAPSITEVAPSPLPIGAQAELIGAGFVSGQTTVTIGTTGQTVVFADATRVRFAVVPLTPLGPQTLVVTVAGESTSASVNVVPPAPRIETVAPDPAVLGELVTIEGIGLGTVTSATLDDAPCTITNQVATLLELRLPFEARLLGQALLLVRSPSGEDGATLMVTAPVPTIDSITPNPVRASALMTVRGTILPQALEVKIGGLAAPIIVAAQGEVMAWVPPDVELGSRGVVVRAAGKDSLPVSLIVQAADPQVPSVSAVYPSRVAAGGSTWVIGEHLDQITRVLPEGTVTIGACPARVCRISTAGLVAGPPFVVALDGPRGAATFQAELVADAPAPVNVTRVEPSPARRGEPLSIFADNAAAVRAVVIGGQVQTIDFFDDQKIVVTVHEQTPLGAETLFVASNVGSEPFAITVLEPAPADPGPEAAEEGAETSEAEPSKRPKDDDCAGGPVGLGLWVAGLVLMRSRRQRGGGVDVDA